MHVIHFDAHTDYAPFIHDLRSTNQHPFRHIAPMKHVQSLTQPNGMSYAELRDTLREIAILADVIGFDFVEVNPQLDVGTGVTSYLGVHTVIEFLGHICDQPRWIAKRHKKTARKTVKRRR